MSTSSQLLDDLIFELEVSVKSSCKGGGEGERVSGVRSGKNKCKEGGGSCGPVAAAVYKPFGGALKCASIPAAAFSAYREFVNAKIDHDGRLQRIHASILEDKEKHSDYDVYLRPHPSKVEIIIEIFGSHVNMQRNGNTFSIQIGDYQTDFTELENPEMAAPYYSASSGIVIGTLVKKCDGLTLRATDLCCDVKGDNFIISKDPESVYSFLGFEVSEIKETRTRARLFQMIEKSWIYDPASIVSQAESIKKATNMRPIMVDFIDYCRDHPKEEASRSVEGRPCGQKTLGDALNYFGKLEEYDEFCLRKVKEKEIQVLRSRARSALVEVIRQTGAIDKDLGVMVEQFKKWVIITYGVDYDIWSTSSEVDGISSAFNQFRSITEQSKP